MFKGHKEARIYNITLFVTHMLICSLWYNCYIYHFAWDACTTRCWWKLLYFSIYGRGTPKIHHNRGKWGLLCKMRTKWGPFQQFGPHEDQVLNWGPLWKHCQLNLVRSAILFSLYLTAHSPSALPASLQSIPASHRSYQYSWNLTICLATFTA